MPAGKAAHQAAPAVVLVPLPDGDGVREVGDVDLDAALDPRVEHPGPAGDAAALRLSPGAVHQAQGGGGGGGGESDAAEQEEEEEAQEHRGRKCDGHDDDVFPKGLLGQIGGQIVDTVVQG